MVQEARLWRGSSFIRSLSNFAISNDTENNPRNGNSPSRIGRGTEGYNHCYLEHL
jgi:hypothetical protein